MPPPQKGQNCLNVLPPIGLLGYQAAHSPHGHTAALISLVQQIGFEKRQPKCIFFHVLLLLHHPTQAALPPQSHLRLALVCHYEPRRRIFVDFYTQAHQHRINK